MKRVISIILIFVAVSLLLLTTCKEDTTSPVEEPLQIPPQSTFLMEFNDFSTGGKAVSTSTQSVLSKNNYNWASLNVGFWSAVMTVTLAIPTAAFIEAFNHEPVLQDDGSWVWSYTFMVLGVQHKAELHGKLEPLKTTWKMYITKQGFYENFLWYSGEANLTITEGEWTLNKNPQEPTQFLQIDWQRNLTTSNGEIKYTNIIPGAAENGSYIYYEMTSDTTYDRQYDLYGKVNNNLTEIEWNKISKAGHVRDPLHFGDTFWHCWNELRDDVQCP